MAKQELSEAEKNKLAELEKKRNSWKGANSSLNYILDGGASGLLDSIIKDYTPIEGKKQRTFPSFGTIFRAIGFAIAHPIHTYNLATKLPKLAADPDFQKELLNNNKLWGFLQSNADRLPQVGKILAGFGYEIFKEGKLLDSKGLTNIKGMLKDEKNLQTIKIIALESLNPFPDWGKVTKEGLQMFANDQNIKEFLATKGKDVQEYIKNMSNAIAPGDALRSMNNIIRNQKFADIKSVILQPEALKNNSAFVADFSGKMLQHLANPQLYSREVIIAELMKNNPEAAKVGKEALDQLMTDAAKQLQTSKYNQLENILQKEPKNKEEAKLQDALALVISKSYTTAVPPELRPIFDQQLFEKGLTESKEFNALPEKDREEIRKFATEAASETKPIVLEYLDLYKVNPKILEHVPAILTKMDEINDIYASLQKDGLFVWVGKSLDMLTKDPELKQFIADNPTFIPDLAKGVIEATPFLKDLMGNLKFDNQILDILGKVLVKPEIAASIISDLNKGDYVKLTETLLNALNDPEVKGFDTLLKEQAKAGLFNNLIKGVLDQNEQSTNANIDKLKKERAEAVEKLKLEQKNELEQLGVTPEQIEALKKSHQESINQLNDQPYSLKDQLKKFGIDPAIDLNKIADILPILLDRPQDLKKVFDSFQKGDYNEMAKDLLLMSKSNPDLSKYFAENRDIFVNILNEVSKQVPLLQGADKGELYDIVPVLLSKPENIDKLIGIISSYEKGNYNDIGKQVIELIGDEPKLRDYFSKNTKLFVGILDNFLKQNEISTNANIEKLKQERLETVEKLKIEQEIELEKLRTKENVQGKEIEALKKSHQEAIDKLNQEPYPISLNEQMKKFGIDPTKDLEKIAGILPILLNNPKDLEKIFDRFQKGEYNEMARDLLLMSESNPALQKYLSDNKDIFVNVLNSVFEQTPALKGLGLKGELYDIVPDLMRHPAELIKIMDLTNKGKYDEVGKEFLTLIQEDQNIKSYFEKNKTRFKEIVTKVAGVEKYGIGDEIAGIFTILLLDEKNKPAIEKLLVLYQEGKWMDLAKETCRFIEESPDFKQYLTKNEENFGKILKIAAANVPALKSAFAGLDVGSVAGTELIHQLLKDPKGIRELIESYEKGYVNVGLKAVGKLYSDPELRGALWNAGYNYLFSAGKEEKQQIVNFVTENLADAEKSVDNKINLTKFLGEKIEELKGQGFPEKNLKKLQELENSKILFDGMELNKVKLSNIDFNGNSFVKANITDVSFNGAILKGSSFESANLNDVSFKGAEIDAATLKTMVESLRKGNNSLAGAKITGDISNINLSGISLKGADLTGVTGINNTNLDGTNLENVTLPKKLDLASAVNIDTAKFSEGVFTEELHQQQIEKLANSVATKIAEKSKEAKEPMSPAQIKALTEQLKDLARADTVVGQNMLDILQKTPEDINNKNFPVDIKQSKHFGDYKDKASNLLTTIYENRLNPKKIKTTLVANTIADELTAKLFGEDGTDRGQDGLIMRKLMQNVVTNFAKENPGVDLNEVLSNPKFKEMLSNFEKEVRNKTQYTNTGMLITGGIQLKQDTISEELTYRLQAGMNAYAGENKLTKQEHEAINNMALEVGTNLFQAGANSSRAADTERIQNLLKDAFYQMKKENPEMNIAELSKDPNYPDLMENITAKIKSETSYTTTGYASGGIWLSPSKVTPELADILKPDITRATNKFKLNVKEMKALDEITQKIGEAIIGKGATVADKKLIKQTLQDVFIKMKGQSGDMDISDLIEKTNVGKYNDKSGLAKLFYDNTTRGYGGTLYVDSDKIAKEDFTKGVRKNVRQAIVETKSEHSTTFRDAIIKERAERGKSAPSGFSKG